MEVCEEAWYLALETVKSGSREDDFYRGKIGLGNSGSRELVTLGRLLLLGGKARVVMPSISLELRRKGRLKTRQVHCVW